MAHELRVSSRAQANITAIYEWYEKRMPGLGADFVRRIDATLLLVQESPQIFRLRRGAMRMAMTSRFPYAVYFIWDDLAGIVSVRCVLRFAQDASSSFASS